MGRFDAILIDFYGTISAGDREIVEATCARIVQAYSLGLSPNDFAQKWGHCFFGIIDQSNHEHFRTLFECEKISLNKTLLEYGVEVDATQFTHELRELEEYWRDPPFYADAIEFLGTNRLPTCCVSNADTEPLIQAINSLGCHFDQLITSEMTRSYKPDPHIFEQAVELIGVSPDRLLHVGDSLHSDIAGAAKLGITTVWVHRESRILDIGNVRPDYTIRTLAELPQLITG